MTDAEARRAEARRWTPEAIAAAFPDVIPATNRGGYLVESQSRPGLWWMLKPQGGRIVCPCEKGTQIERERADVGAPAFCRHGRRLLAYTAATNEAAKRPSAPANVSALVD